MRTQIKHIMMLWIILLFSASASEKTWDGKWHAFWKQGSIVLTMEQHGNDVNGTYQPLNGKLTGYIENNKLHAVTVNDDGSGKLTMTMSQSGNSFFGINKYGDWITSIRVDADDQYNALTVNTSLPLNTFYSFLKLVNRVRSGEHEALEKALNLLDLNEEQQKYLYGKKLHLARTFFHILDACTVEKYNFKLDVEGDRDFVILHQAGTDNTVEVNFIKENDVEGWKIILPGQAEMKETLRTLMTARELDEVDPNANLKLANPRDTMRTIIEQYDRWKKNGKAHVLSTMNLSTVDPAIWEWQAPLLSYYLLGVINRISEVVYQEIPNDPKSKKPYVHFHHPIGDIVIAPYEIEGKTQWKFTPETLETIEVLFEEIEDVPLHVPMKTISENDLYFKLKHLARSISPLLVEKFYDTALWQIVLLALIVFLAAWISYFSKWFTFKIVKRFYLTKRWTDEMITLRFLRPVQILIFGLLLLYGAHQLGLSDFLFAIIKTFTRLLIVLGVAWIIFELIDIIITFFKIRAKRKALEVDDIFLSIVSSILRIGVIIAAIFIIAEIFGVPYKTVVAGLGIGGLAFAIAAKDTIANFFGSAIIIADRPFKTGDKIKIGSDIGIITNVGIRSTRIRTIYDTVLTVPNNKITQEMIDNYTERDAMRVDTEFFFSLNTNKEILDDLDAAMTKFLKENKSVDTTKIILTGVNDYTKRGISFGLTFFVQASNDMEYSDIRHRLVTDLAQIIKESGIELVMIKQDYKDD